GEVVVVAVMRSPHRVNERAIRGVLVVELLRELLKFRHRTIGLVVRRAFPERDRLWFTGGGAAFQQDVNQFGDRAAGGENRQNPPAPPCSPPIELRGQARAPLLFPARPTP